MAILFVSDKSGIGCAGWVLRALSSDIAEILTENGHQELAKWLVDDLSPVNLYSCLDVRELTPANQEAFIKSIEPAFLRSKTRGRAGWNDPAAFGRYLKLFGSLVEQNNTIQNGGVPKSLPNLNGISNYDGTRSGPGWETNA